MNNFAICGDSRPCFAKHYNNTTHRHFCNCLSSPDVPVYKDGDCPFCKPLHYMTNGKEYMTYKERRRAQLEALDMFRKREDRHCPEKTY